MATMKNYYFGIREKDCNSIIRLVDYRENENFHMSGNCYEKNGFSDGTHVVTSEVTTICGNILTSTGSVYKVEDMHPDYISFISAINKGIPVLHDWDISGTQDTGYTFYALDKTNQSIAGRVLKQEGNYLYLNINGDARKFFIDWLSVDEDDLSQLHFCGNIPNSDISLDMMEMFCNEKRRPILFANPKE